MGARRPVERVDPRQHLELRGAGRDRFVPAGFVRWKTSVEAPTGIVTFSCVSLTGVIASSVVPSFASDTCARFVPLIVTVDSTGAEVGLKELTVGWSTTVKLAVLVPVPPAS